MDKGQSKRITFLGLNASYSHSMLSYGYIRSYTEEKLPEWKWSLVEKTINEKKEAIINEIITTSPDVLILTCYLFNIEYSLKIIKKIKQLLPELKIFSGGPEFLGDNKNFLLKNPEWDAVFRGDETSFYQVLENIDSRKNWKKIPGICYLDEKSYIDVGTSLFSGNPDTIPSPFQKGLFSKSKPFVHIETSRGCNGKCSFCTSSLSNGISCFSLDRVFNDLNCLEKEGIKEIRVIDRTFNDPEERSIKLLEMFHRNFSEMRFHLEINPAILMASQIEVMQKFKPGKLHIEIGIQSCSSDTLKSVKRYGTADKSMKGLESICSLKKIPVHADLIFGLPGQTFQNVLEDVQNMILFNPDEIQLESLKILPGTELRKMSGIKWNPDPPYQVLNTPQLDSEKLHKLEILSLILDCYFNTPKLKNLFIYICRKENSFIKSLIKGYLDVSGKNGKLSHKKRFQLLEKFMPENDITSALYKFSWLAAGLPRTRFNLKTKKEKLNCRKKKTLWQNPKHFPSKRYIIVSFPYNIALKWLDPEDEPELKKTTYIFNIAYGNVISSIEEIEI